MGIPCPTCRWSVIIASRPEGARSGLLPGGCQEKHRKLRSGTGHPGTMAINIITTLHENWFISSMTLLGHCL